MAYKIIKNGTATVKIYKIKCRKYHIYTVTYLADGQRKRVTRSSETAAVILAEEIAEFLHHSHRPLAKLTYDQLTDARKALRHLNGAVSLEDVALFYAVKVLGKNCPSTHVRDALKKFLMFKQTEGRTDVYLRSLRVHLTNFADHFDCLLAALTSERVENFVVNSPGGLRHKENIRGSILTFLNFARENGYTGELFMSDYMPRREPIFMRSFKRPKAKRVRPVTAAEKSFFQMSAASSLIASAQPSSSANS